MSIKPGKTYKITNVQSGLVLHLSEGDGKYIVGNRNENSFRQLWIPLSLLNGRMVINSAENGQSIGFKGRPEEGVVDLIVGGSSISHAWDIQQLDEESKYKISLRGTPFVVELPDGNVDAGAHVRLSEDIDEDNQFWVFKEVAST